MTRYPMAHRDQLLCVGGLLGGWGGASVFLHGTAYKWVGIWTETGQAVRGSLLLAGPFLAAIGAYLGSVERQNGLADIADTAPLGQVRRNAIPVAYLATIAALVILVPATVASLITRSIATYGGYPYPFIAVALAGAFAMSFIGYALGRHIAWQLLPLAVTVGAYFVIAYLSSTASLGLLSPFDERGVTGAIYPALLLVSTVAWLVAVAVVSLALACRQRVLALALACLAIGAASVVIKSPPFPYNRDPEALQLTCAPADPDSQVCLTRVHGYMRKQLDELVREVEAPLAHTGLAPTRYIEVVDATNGRFGSELRFASANRRALGSAQIDLAVMRDQLATFVLDPRCAQTEGPTRNADGSDVVRAWYRLKVGVPAYDPVDINNVEQVADFRAAVDRLTGLPDVVRQEFLERNAVKILSCSLSMVELP